MFVKHGFCPTCNGPCALTGSGVPFGWDDVVSDLQTCQEYWRKNLRAGNYFRAQYWAQNRDACLDHLHDMMSCGAHPDGFAVTIGV